jgi:hypothetical protein
MRAKSIIIFVVAGVVVVASAGSAWHDARSSQEADVAATAVTQRRAAATPEFQRMEFRLAEAEKTRVKLQAEILAGEKAAGAKTGTAAPTKALSSVADEQLSAFIQKEREAEKDPQIQLLQRAARRAKSVATFGLLFRTLGLSPDQIEKFQDNVGRRQEQMADLLAVVGELGLTLSDPGPARFWGKIAPEYQAAQKELLGDAGYRQLQDYERASDTRGLVGRMAGVATVTGVPFTTEQVEQFTRLLKDANSDYRTGGNAYLFKIDWSMVDAQAGAILSEAQLNLVKTIEPPGGSGRFWGRVNRVLMQAEKADAEIAKPTPALKPGGG